MDRIRDQNKDGMQSRPRHDSYPLQQALKAVEALGRAGYGAKPSGVLSDTKGAARLSSRGIATRTRRAIAWYARSEPPGSH